MFCQNCGHELKENAKFCQNCGTKAVSKEVKEKVDVSIENEEIIEEVSKIPVSEIPVENAETITDEPVAEISETLTESKAIKSDDSVRKSNASGGLKTGCLGFLALLLPAIGLLTLPIVLKIIIFIVATIVIICKFRKEPKKMWAWIAILVGITLIMTMVSCSIGCISNIASVYNSSGNSSSNKIYINEVGDYNNEFGNMKVTLDYVEFTDVISYQGTRYADDGMIFMKATLTVENVGTNAGSLLSAWNTVVYDNKYEYRYFTTDGGAIDIQPLSSPEEANIIFMIPEEAKELDKPLELRINYSDGSPLIVYDITGNNKASSSSPSASKISADKITYKKTGTPVSDYIAISKNYVYELIPFSPIRGTDTTGDYYLGGYYIGFEGLDLIFGDYDCTEWAVADPFYIEVNGQTLNKNRDELVRILGTPDNEGEMYDEMSEITEYTMEYTFTDQYEDEYTFMFILPDMHSESTDIIIYSNFL